MSYAPYAVAAYLFAIGLFGVVRSRNLIQMVVCLAVVQASTYFMLLGVGYRAGATAPIFIDIPIKTPAVDPVGPGPDPDRHRGRGDGDGGAAGAVRAGLQTVSDPGPGAASTLQGLTPEWSPCPRRRCR